MCAVNGSSLGYIATESPLVSLIRLVNDSGCPGIDIDHSHIPDKYGLHMTSRNHCLKSFATLLG
jgi:hypothetical protein